MKIKGIAFWALIVLAVACSREEIDHKTDLSGISANEEAVTFLGELNGGVSVLIFENYGSQFYYKKRIDQGWSDEGRVTTSLKLGNYKCLFTKFAGEKSAYSDNSMTPTSSIEDVRIVALKDTDPKRDGYVLPVDEVWLPESLDVAAKIHTITGGDTIRGEISRAVSQLVLKLKRGYKENGSYVELPYTNGGNILDDVEGVSFDIKKVGSAVNPNGGIGLANTYYSTASADSVMTGGYAHFTGPFVFPNEAKTESLVEITVIPKAGSKFSEMKGSVTGLLERNRRLEITLWVTAVYEFIDVTIRTEPISVEKDGDKGIWD